MIKLSQILTEANKKSKKKDTEAKFTKGLSGMQKAKITTKTRHAMDKSMEVPADLASMPDQESANFVARMLNRFGITNEQFGKLKTKISTELKKIEKENE